MTATVLAVPVLGEGSSARVLRFLWESRSEWSGREIARQLGLSAPSCHETLKKLNAQGFVLFRGVSNVHLYKINPDNYLVQRLFAPFFEAQKAIPGEIAKLIKRTLLEREEARIRSLVLFGSRARGEAGLSSDLDLLVVAASDHERKLLEPSLEKLRKLLAQRFNISFAPYVQTIAEIREKHRAKLPVIAEILKDGETLHGPDLGELIS